MTYTLKLDLSEDELNTLKAVLITDLQRSEREGTTDSPHATNVANILDHIQMYGAFLAAPVITAERLRDK